MPALEGTLAGLGIDLREQPNVELDVEQREKKSPRAFCAPIEVPGRVVLVIQPMGGPDDWRALFHEAGHTEHFANTSADLPMESKRLGDNAVTEGWAFLFEHLVDDPAWLTRRLDFPRPQEFAAEGAAMLLCGVRRYCAKLLYELELLQADDPLPFEQRYVELLGDALKIAAEPDGLARRRRPGLLREQYLRAWAFEAQLVVPPARALRERLVRAAGGGVAAPGAVVARPGPDRGRAARRRHGHRDRHGGGHRARPRAARLGSCQLPIGPSARNSSRP